MACVGSFARNCDTPVTPGVKQIVYLTFANELTGMPKTMKELTPNTTVKGADVILNEPFPFNTVPGEGFFRAVQIKPDKGSIDFPSGGEAGSLGFRPSFEFEIAGTDAATTSFAKALAENCCGVVLLIPERDGNYTVLGNNSDPCLVEEVKGGSGKKVGDNRGFTFKITDPSGRLPMKYNVSATNIIKISPNP